MSKLKDKLRRLHAPAPTTADSAPESIDVGALPSRASAQEKLLSAVSDRPAAAAPVSVRPSLKVSASPTSAARDSSAHQSGAAPRSSSGGQVRQRLARLMKVADRDEQRRAGNPVPRAVARTGIPESDTAPARSGRATAGQPQGREFRRWRLERAEQDAAGEAADSVAVDDVPPGGRLLTGSDAADLSPSFSSDETRRELRHRADLAEASGDFVLAVELLQRAVTLAGADPLPHVALGRVYADGLRRPDLALRHLKLAQSRAPWNESIRMQIRRLESAIANED